MLSRILKASNILGIGRYLQAINFFAGLALKHTCRVSFDYVTNKQERIVFKRPRDVMRAE